MDRVIVKAQTIAQLTMICLFLLTSYFQALHIYSPTFMSVLYLLVSSNISYFRI